MMGGANRNTQDIENFHPMQNVHIRSVGFMEITVTAGVMIVIRTIGSMQNIATNANRTH